MEDVVFKQRPGGSASVGVGKPQAQSAIGKCFSLADAVRTAFADPDVVDDVHVESNR
jgi:hypothetical protein